MNPRVKDVIPEENYKLKVLKMVRLLKIIPIILYNRGSSLIFVT